MSRQVRSILRVGLLKCQKYPRRSYVAYFCFKESEVQNWADNELSNKIVQLIGCYNRLACIDHLLLSVRTVCRRSFDPMIEIPGVQTSFTEINQEIFWCDQVIRLKSTVLYMNREITNIENKDAREINKRLLFVNSSVI